MGTYVRRLYSERGIKTMTANEQELISLIRENDNPEIALVTAVESILSFLAQLGSFQEQAVADLRGLA